MYNCDETSGLLIKSSEKSDETSGSKETKKSYADRKSSEESDETSKTKEIDEQESI